MDERAFLELLDYLAAVPAVSPLSHGEGECGRWWVKLSVDMTTPSRGTSFELGYVLRYISVEECLPTVRTSIARM
jgi:hypothetical protein